MQRASACANSRTDRSPPLARVSNFESPMTIRSRCIRFSVRVPVLSAHMCVTDPSVSTAGSRRMSTFLRLSFAAPSASEIVITAGSASGIAATASETAVRNIKMGGSPRHIPKRNTRAQIISIAKARRPPNRANLSCNGVRLNRSLDKRVAIRPSSVCIPVATTRPRPRP